METVKKQEDKDKFEAIADELGCDTSDSALDEIFENLELKPDRKGDAEKEN